MSAQALAFGFIFYPFGESRKDSPSLLFYQIYRVLSTGFKTFFRPFDLRGQGFAPPVLAPLDDRTPISSPKKPPERNQKTPEV